MERVMSLVGLMVMIGIAYGFSTSRKNIRWKTVTVGIGLQLFFCTYHFKNSIW